LPEFRKDPHCPQELIDCIYACLAFEADKRPTFEEVAKILMDIYDKYNQ
jgi:hypothetical protein